MIEQRIYTIHAKRRDAVAVRDLFSPLALVLPPAWAIWHGLWISLAVIVALPLCVALWSPLAAPPVYYGLALLLALEGAAVQRAELWLRGWRLAATVEAQSAAGAEELYLRGDAA